jgi:hypothetical protein
MAVGPILIQQNAKIAQFIGGASRRFQEAAEEASISEEGQGLSDHVLLCGCRRVGRLVASGSSAVLPRFDLTSVTVMTSSPRDDQDQG